MLPTKGIEVGAAAPEWQLKGLDGRRVSLGQFRGRSLLLFFFRGTWCPNCRKQMEQIAAEWQRIEKLAAVVGIVGEGQREVADFVSRNPLPFTLLPDPTREVIKQFDVYQRFSLSGFRIAHPTTVIIDRAGVVQYCYVGDSQFDRPDLNKVIETLQSLQALTS